MSEGIGWLRNAMLALGSLVLCGLALEGAARLLVDEERYPADGAGLMVVPSENPRLVYELRPSHHVVMGDVAIATNAAGFRDDEFSREKPPATRRIAAIGDSVAFGFYVEAEQAFPQRLEARARARGERVEVLNLGVPGYTAYQGRRLLETRGARLEADAVVISFGWNDHLLALGFTDAQQDVGGAQVVAARNWLQASRVYQALSWLLAAARGGAASGGEGATPGGAGAGPLRRVGPADFRGEMEEMIRLVRSLGAIPVLCTYPTALSVMESGGHPAPEWLVETHAGRGGAREVRRLQDAYNDIVRQVGSAAGAPVIDLERAFQEAGKEALFDYPGGDFIHPNEPGYDAVARLVYTTLEGLASRR